jgi:hypothetical protein
MGPRRQQLLSTAQQFCEAFKSKAEVDAILAFFSSTHHIYAIEHGEPALAPFLGRHFTGAAGIREYFETVNAVLTYENLTFSDFVVDEENRKVALKGQGMFQWRSTKESWDEAFAYILSFDEEGKIMGYQVWADSGAAYLARIGKLNEIRVRG